jgi:hypothetical protein
MGSTCALLGPVSGEMSREAVERLLASDSSIEVVHASEWEFVLHTLGSDKVRFDVLIADFGTAQAPGIDALLRDYPDLSIAAINLRGFDTHLWNVDSRLFVTFISALGRDSAAERGAQELASKVAWSTCAFTQLPPVRADTPCPSLDDQMAELCAWLDAVLSRVLARAVGLSDARDIAGLTMGIDTARKLLGSDNARRGDDALDEAIEAAEARLLRLCRHGAGAALPLRMIEDGFDLDALERRIFWLALAPEIDDRYGRVIGVINDDLGRRRPTPALLAAALADLRGEWQLFGRLTGPRRFARLGLVVPDAADADMPWPQTGLVCAPDIVELVLTGAARRHETLTRIAA